MCNVCPAGKPERAKTFCSRATHLFEQNTVNAKRRTREKASMTMPKAVAVVVGVSFRYIDYKSLSIASPSPPQQA
jgi:hypothetical protein